MEEVLLIRLVVSSISPDRYATFVNRFTILTVAKYIAHTFTDYYQAWFRYKKDLSLDPSLVVFTRAI